MTLTRVQPLGFTDNWVVSKEELTQIDINAASGVDGRAGETDTVESDLTFTGDVVFNSGSSATVNSGATFNVNANMTMGSGADIVLGAGSTITYSPAHTIIRVANIQSFAPRLTAILDNTGDFHVLTGVAGGSANMWINEVINGATLTQVTLQYKLEAGARTPATRIKLGMWRRELDDPDTDVSMQSTGILEVSSYSTYETWIGANFTIDQNNVIDKATYSYRILIQDESGSGAISGNLFSNLRFTYTVSDPLTAGI